jgi:peroxiredoxin
MRCIFLLLSTACTPHLVSGEERVSGATWEAPENRWGVNTPPADLKGQGYAVGQVPHDFRLVDQFGETVSLWQFYGSVVLLDISTMWCRPCQQIASEVTETWHDYQDEGFIYLTMLPEDVDGNSPDNEDLNQWADSFEIEAPVLGDDGTYAYAVEPNSLWPVLMLIERDMRIVADRIEATDEAIRGAIEETL